MKAMLYYEYGPPETIQCAELPMPVPGDKEVLLRVRAASLNPLDCHLMKGAPAPIRMLFRLTPPSREKPGLVGRDVAGVVEAVGKDVTEFKPGDEVFGCAAGACSEFVCASDARLALKPANVTLEEAACAGVAGFTALQGLRDKGHVKAGDRVLINGASGGVGTFAVQIAKAYGAEVTAVCSAANAELVRSIGADHVVDYKSADFTKSGNRYDILFDLVSNHSLRSCSRAMTPLGTYLGGGILDCSVPSMLARMLMGPIRSKLGKKSFPSFMARSNKEDLVTLAGLMGSGKVKPVIDRTYTLSQLPEAMRYLATKRARGKVVIVVD